MEGLSFAHSAIISQMWHHIRWPGLLALVVVLVACSQGTPTSEPSATVGLTSTPSATSTPRPTDAARSRYRSAECLFQVAAGQVVECGYLTVPEDRRDPDGASIHLHVAVFESPNDDSADDPLVYLSGGPGSSALKELEFVFDDLVEPFLSQRDVIVLDQRGTGFSKPAVDCPEFVEAVHDTLDRDLTIELESSLTIGSLVACRDRLEGEGVNLEGYTSAENAADLEDLRLALGYESWNLLGVSYGTRLALTAMRDFPEGIRSVILDSTVPLEVDAYTNFLPNADRAFTTLFDGCAAHPVCNATHPQLETVFFRLAGVLAESPVIFPITHPLTGETFDLLFSVDELTGFLFQSLYITDIIPLLPDIIFRAGLGDFAAVAALEGAFLTQLDDISVGMHYSVQCGEEAPFTSQEDLDLVAETHPRLRGLADRNPILQLCRAWGARQANSSENQAVKSDIPTLVLAGEYDPITPPSWGRLAVGSLANGVFFEFPGVGHGVAFSGGHCPLDIARDFLANPGTGVDANCIEKMEGPDFSRALR